jgi:hypothetical protein
MQKSATGQMLLSVASTIRFSGLMSAGLIHDAAGAEVSPPGPNILLIVAEDMSSRVGAFGDVVARSCGGNPRKFTTILLRRTPTT